MAEKNTLIVNYARLKIGGIEEYLSVLMRHAISQGHRVIWLTTKSAIAASDYPDITADERIEKVFIKDSVFGKRYPVPALASDECVIMLSFEPLGFVFAEALRRKTKAKEFYHFLVLPHFTGNAYYPERYFHSGPARAACYKIFKRQAQRWAAQDCIRAFSMEHLETYEANYGIRIKNKPDKVLKAVNAIPPYDRVALLRKAQEKGKDFRLVTCTRFDFPHKGYLLGLIDEYARLRCSGRDATLTIVGYGKDEVAVRSKIDALPEAVKNGIRLTGKLDKKQWYQVLQESHLNIGLAGAASAGARQAVPTLYVRHYTYDCQTYGFLNTAPEGKVLRDDPGRDIKPFIEQVMDADTEEYLQLCKNEYEFIQKNYTIDPDYFFRQSNESSAAVVSYPREGIYRLVRFGIAFCIKFFHERSY